MGRENTIKTGTTTGGGRSRVISDTSISNNSGLVNTGLGRVTQTFGDKSIEYISLNNRYGFTKKGYAVPFDPNISNPPPVGSSVLLISAPLDTGENNAAQFGGRKTFYSVIVNSNGNVGGTYVDTSGTGGGGYVPPGAKGTPSIEANKLTIKNYLKAKGLTREAAAGVMGNIQAECDFVPTVSFPDVNGLESYGLVQWNGSRDGSGKGFDLRVVPPTVEGQLDLMFNGKFHPEMNKWLAEIKPNPTGTNNDGMSGPAYMAYLFAKTVEICFGCKKIDEYKNGATVKKGPYAGKTFYPIKRSNFAQQIFTRFNDPNDPLAWDGPAVISKVPAAPNPITPINQLPFSNNLKNTTNGKTTPVNTKQPDSSNINPAEVKMIIANTAIPGAGPALTAVNQAIKNFFPRK
jgi:hypothetical protein